MRFSSRKFLTAALLFSAACTTPNSAVAELEYFKDPRTGYCFAAAEAAGTNGTFVTLTWVPCDHIPTQLLKVAK